MNKNNLSPFELQSDVFNVSVPCASNRYYILLFIPWPSRIGL